MAVQMSQIRSSPECELSAVPGRPLPVPETQGAPGSSAPPSGAPPRPALRVILKAALGGGLAVLALTLLGAGTGADLLMAPFGASCVLLFALPESPLSQPRAVIGGHLAAAAIGIAVAQGLGVSHWTMALAVGLAILAMQATRTTHAPAGATPLVAMAAHADWDFLVTPVAVGAALLVVLAAAHHRIHGTAYPRYWR